MKRENKLRGFRQSNWGGGYHVQFLTIEVARKKFFWGSGRRVTIIAADPEGEFRSMP